ncbi:MAG: hypothetical protein IJ330_04090, partial [Oscillospiraceae bacterium]|nr:hypothetical protein [Oscillospiraceae bacterium]
MNMKKTLAGLMAGVVAISAMATVAVSAKAQESKTKTWSTSWTQKEKEGTKAAKVIVTLTPATTAATQGTPASFEADLTGSQGITA